MGGDINGFWSSFKVLSIFNFASEGGSSRIWLKLRSKWVREISSPISCGKLVRLLKLLLTLSASNFNSLPMVGGKLRSLLKWRSRILKDPSSPIDSGNPVRLLSCRQSFSSFSSFDPKLVGQTSSWLKFALSSNKLLQASTYNTNPKSWEKRNAHHRPCLLLHATRVDTWSRLHRQINERK